MYSSNLQQHSAHRFKHPLVAASAKALPEDDELAPMLKRVAGETRPVRLSVLVEGTSVCSQLMVAGDMDGPFSSPAGDMLLFPM